MILRPLRLDLQFLMTGKPQDLLLCSVHFVVSSSGNFSKAGTFSRYLNLPGTMG